MECLHSVRGVYSTSEKDLTAHYRSAVCQRYPGVPPTGHCNMGFILSKIQPGKRRALQVRLNNPPCSWWHHSSSCIGLSCWLRFSYLWLCCCWLLVWLDCWLDCWLCYWLFWEPGFESGLFSLCCCFLPLPFRNKLRRFNWWWLGLHKQFALKSQYCAPGHAMLTLVSFTFLRLAQSSFLMWIG